MDYVSPWEVVSNMVGAGSTKGALPAKDLLIRGFLSGALLGFATSLAITATVQSGVPLVGALVFPVGFVMIVVLGLELATGSFALLPLAYADGKLSLSRMLANFGWVLLGNLIGSVTGHSQFAADAGIVVKSEESVAVAAAIIRVFAENGDRTDRKKARLKYLVDRWGIPKFVEEMDKKLAFPLQRLALADCRLPHPSVLHGHLGVYKQKQKGLNYIGAAIPVGRLRTRQMRGIADLAENYGNGDLRLTVWQNLLITNVPDAYVETAKRSLVRIGLHYEANSITGGVIACTGNTGCKFAATNTKGQAVELAKYLEKRVSLDQPINIHLTGCPNSCAQHYIGDIGLLGVQVGQSGKQVEGYHVFFGGSSGQNETLGREVFHGIPFGELPALLEKVLKTYLAKRTNHESFKQFVSRREVKELQEMFSE